MPLWLQLSVQAADEKIGFRGIKPTIFCPSKGMEEKFPPHGGLPSRERTLLPGWSRMRLLSNGMRLRPCNLLCERVRCLYKNRVALKGSSGSVMQ